VRNAEVGAASESAALSKVLSRVGDVVLGDIMLVLCGR
jgi:hypothetical protein